MARTTIAVHRHEVTLWVDLDNTFVEGQPVKKYTGTSSGLAWIWWLVGAAVLVLIFFTLIRPGKLEPYEAGLFLAHIY